MSQTSQLSQVSEINEDASKSDDSWIAVSTVDNANTSNTVEKVDNIATMSNEKSENTTTSNNNKNNGGKKKTRRHRRRKKQNNKSNDAITTTDTNGSVSTTSNNINVNNNNNNYNNTSNKNNTVNTVNTINTMSGSNSPNKQSKSSPKKVKSSIGTTFSLKASKKPTNRPMRPVSMNNNGRNAWNSNSNGAGLDDIMNQEKISNIVNKQNKISNDNIESMLTEEEILQAVLAESMQQQPQSQQNGNDNNNNEKHKNNINIHQEIANDVNNAKDSIETTVDIDNNNNNNNSKTVETTSNVVTNDLDIAQAAQMEEESKLNDFLLAMSLQEKEETDYMHQKAWQERNAGSKYAKVQSVGKVSEESLKFYYKNKMNEKDGENNNNNNNSDKNNDKNKNNKDGSKGENSGKEIIDEELYSWHGGHVGTSGSFNRHDKKTWNKKHVSRMNDYDGIGDALDNSVTISNHAYNSFCRSVERKGFKRDYM